MATRNSSHSRPGSGGRTLACPWDEQESVIPDTWWSTDCFRNSCSQVAGLIAVSFQVRCGRLRGGSRQCHETPRKPTFPL